MFVPQVETVWLQIKTLLFLAFTSRKKRLVKFKQKYILHRHPDGSNLTSMT